MSKLPETKFKPGVDTDAISEGEGEAGDEEDVVGIVDCDGEGDGAVERVGVGEGVGAVDGVRVGEGVGVGVGVTE